MKLLDLYRRDKLHYTSFIEIMSVRDDKVDLLYANSDSCEDITYDIRDFIEELVKRFGFTAAEIYNVSEELIAMQNDDDKHKAGHSI
jgi:hypothetical protein